MIDMAEAIIDMAGGGRIEHVAWPALADQIETGDFVADVSRIRAELGWAPAMSLATGCGRRSLSTRRMSRRDGAPRACRLPVSRVHGRRRGGDGAQPGSAPSRSLRAVRHVHQPGRADWRGDQKDRRARSGCSVWIPASGGPGTCSGSHDIFVSCSRTSCTRSCSPRACTDASPPCSPASRSSSAPK